MKLPTFNNILVGLDASYMDKSLLTYVNWLLRSHPNAQTYFLQILDSLEIPPFTVPKDEELFEITPMDEKLVDEMKVAVKEELGEKADQSHFDVLEGKVTQQMLHWAKTKNIDLTLLGLKSAPHYNDISAKRFLRNTQSSVWFVTKETASVPKKILVATDFSPHADLAVEMAIQLASSVTPAADVELLHVLNVPTDFQYRLNQTYTQYAEKLKVNTLQYMEEYVTRFDSSEMDGTLSTHLIQNTYFNAARHIHEYASESYTDLVILGALGHSALSSFLLGSVSEMFLDLNNSISTLILRPSST